MDFEIKDIWAFEQEILDVIHDICKKNKIRYSLFYGTLIGAVRHKGFIPWDDDIDIAMPRKDYDRFVKIWNANPPKGYLLQDYHDWSDLPNNFSKIRKDHTAFIQMESEKRVSYHTGFFVDIFPVDRVAPSNVGKKIQYISAAINLLYTRGYTSGTGGVIGMIEKILLHLPVKMRKPFLSLTERIVTSWNGKADTDYFSCCTIGSCKEYFPADMFKGMKLIEFNGKKYLSVSDPDAVLKITYGDYMKLPPEEERVWKHHPILVDFEHNYDEIAGENE